MTNPSVSKPRDLADLAALSAEIGRDPVLIQAAGGNTSVKDDGVMWIKASGTWLAHAQEKDIFVPVALAPLMDAMERGDPAAEKAQDFVIADLNPGGLRPSIETTVHAVFPQRVVIHVHCVDTIAVAVQQDFEAIAAARLSGHDHISVPYCRPGLPLSQALKDQIGPGTDVAILGNHGLVVAADDVEAAHALLSDICGRQCQPVRSAPRPDTDALLALAGDNYRLPAEPGAHAVACDPVSLAAARAGSLYPDHVIFLGAGSVIAEDGETADAVAARIRASGRPDPVSILFPGKGVLMHRDANAGAEALALCLSDVTARLPANAALHTLTDEEVDQLLNWDAEKYRQTLNRAGSTA
ncbi:MAG: class II aldolase [Rhodobiaceae bacterium]|nr:class II aldolase [Rhodobiaceae bacterium]